jgi:hypothetical protein
MTLSAITQMVPVMMLRPGTGHLFQRILLATLGPAIASMNGHVMRAMTASVGMTTEKTSSFPSLMNWKRNRKYQSGRGMVTARGSAYCSSWRFFCTKKESRPTVTMMDTMITG